MANCIRFYYIKITAIGENSMAKKPLTAAQRARKTELQRLRYNGIDYERLDQGSAKIEQSVKHELMVLDVLADNKPHITKEVAAKVGLSYAAVYYYLKRFREDELVKLTPSGWQLIPVNI
jgi:predicted transcriptional regulator